ncbi:hypothetical protein FKM82_014328 [Ascaphus truei]
MLLLFSMSHFGSSYRLSLFYFVAVYILLHFNSLNGEVSAIHDCTYRFHVFVYYFCVVVYIYIVIICFMYICDVGRLPSLSVAPVFPLPTFLVPPPPGFQVMRDQVEIFRCPPPERQL